MRIRIALAFCSGIIAFGGCSNSAGNPAEKTKSAIERVLNADKQLSKARENLPPKATPSQIAWAIGAYCDGLEKIEMADCPADFRVAYTQHIRAWRAAQAAIQQLPDSFLEGFFKGAVNAFLRREMDGGASRLEGDLKQALERVRTTWEEVEKIGAKYGAAV